MAIKLKKIFSSENKTRMKWIKNTIVIITERYSKSFIFFNGNIMLNSLCCSSSKNLRFRSTKFVWIHPDLKNLIIKWLYYFISKAIKVLLSTYQIQQPRKAHVTMYFDDVAISSSLLHFFSKGFLNKFCFVFHRIGLHGI